MLKSGIVTLAAKVLIIACFGLSACTYNYDDTVEAADSGTVNGDAMRGWGIAKDLVMGENNSQPQSVLNAAFKDSKGESEACQYTVQIAIEQSPPAYSENGPPNLRATIKWLTNGKTIQRIVSVGNGTSVSGSGEGATVYLQDFTTNVPDEALADYTAIVALVPGSRPSTSSPPTLVPLVSEARYFGPSTPPSPNLPGNYTLLPGQGVYVDVPQNAGVQSAYITPGVYGSNPVEDVVTSVEVFQYDVNGNVLSVYPANIGDGFIPLAPQCNQLFITNLNSDNNVELGGTSTFVTGSPNVVGTNTHYLEQVEVDQWVKLTSDPYSAFGQIMQITDDTHMTLRSNYSGTSATGTALLVNETGDITGIGVLWGIDG